MFLPVLIGLLVLSAACSNDLIPEHEPHPVQPPEQQPATQVATEAVEDEVSADAASQPRWVEGRLIIELRSPALIYPRPGLSWQALKEAPTGTQLTIDGQDKCDGEVWLRLMSDRGDAGWLRLRDVGFAQQDARWLPAVRPPFHLARLRWDRIAVDLGVNEPGQSFWVDNTNNSHWLVGRSFDSMKVAIELLNVDSEPFVIWVNAQSADFEQSIDSLPIYIGECCLRKLPETLAIAEIAGLGASIATRPHGKLDSHRLKGGDGEQYPIIGRSVDAEWIALRVNVLSQGYVWTPIADLTLNVEVDEIPVLIGSATEALSIDSEEKIGAGYAITESFSSWGWLSDGRFVGADDEGHWQWNPDTGELDVLAETPPPIYSPDGAFFANRQCSEPAATDACSRDVAITSVERGTQLMFPNVTLNQTYRTRGPQFYPWLAWSPNSRYLLNAPPATYWSDHVRLEVLGVDGVRSSLPSDHQVRWLADSTLLMKNDEGAYHVYRADGVRLRSLNFNFSIWHRPEVSSSEPLMVAAGQTLGSDEPPAYHLIDLSTGELTRLPSALDGLNPTWDGPLDWRPLLFSGASLYFYFDRFADDRVHDEWLQRYDLSTGTLSPVDGVRFSSDPWLSARTRCLDDCRTFAVSFSQRDRKAVYIIRSEALADGRPSVTEVEDAWPVDFRDIHDWSPDGSRLLLKKWVELLPYDLQGFATPHKWSNIVSEEWGLVEYQIVDSADGRVTHRYRALPETCGRINHRGAWSPDGRWIAFAPEAVGCK